MNSDMNDALLPMDRQCLRTAKRVVIKLGTQVVMTPQEGFSHLRVHGLVEQCASLQKAGKEIILVSSGAVGLGRQELGLTGALELPEKQACAAVGQTLLMNTYRELFALYQQKTAQVLLTASDFASRERYLNLRETLETLLEMKVIPIINENDTVSIQELQEEHHSRSFGDNDKLSALVASKLGADLLVLLTNVNGLYTANPQTNPDAQPIPRVDQFDALSQINVSGQSAYGRGGMSSKLDAARIASISGVMTLMLSGLDTKPLQILLKPETTPFSGTLVLPETAVSQKKPLPEKKRWIALASGYSGVIVVNAGAKKALMEKGASLLPSGIIQVDGQFQARQVVSIQDEEGREIGRGLTDYAADEVRRIQGKHSQEVKTLLPQLGSTRESLPDEVIHRDHLVIF